MSSMNMISTMAQISKRLSHSNKQQAPVSTDNLWDGSEHAENLSWGLDVNLLLLGREPKHSLRIWVGIEDPRTQVRAPQV